MTGAVVMAVMMLGFGLAGMRHVGWPQHRHQQVAQVPLAVLPVEGVLVSAGLGHDKGKTVIAGEVHGMGPLTPGHVDVAVVQTDRTVTERLSLQVVGDDPNRWVFTGVLAHNPAPDASVRVAYHRSEPGAGGVSDCGGNQAAGLEQSQLTP